MIREKLKKLKLNTTATAEKYMGYSRAITAYCQTCNSSHRAKGNERRLTLNTRGANGFSPEKPLFTITIDASIAREYYKRLGVKFFRTRFAPITMVVYIT